MNSVFLDVLAFHRKFGCATGTTPAVPDDSVVALRRRLLYEKYWELFQAIAREDLPGIAKEAVDLIYVAVGLLIAYGIDPSWVWAAVHAANMSKDGSKRGDGKVTKGDGYLPPPIEKLMALQGPLS